MASRLRRRPPARRGGEADRRPRGHGEEPRTPYPPPAARRPAGRRTRMTEPDYTVNDDGELDLGGVDLSRVWIGVAAEVWRRRPGPAERTAARLLRSPGLARALLTTPSLMAPWLISTVVVFVVG